jgi:hypothetical protein
VAPSATPVLIALVFSIMYINRRCLKLVDFVGRSDVIMADSCVACGTDRRKAVCVCGPSSTRATKVPRHHDSPNEPTGVGEET